MSQTSKAKRRSPNKAYRVPPRLGNPASASGKVDPDTPSADTGQGASRTKSTLGSLIDVRKATAVLIQDTWVGYSPLSPISASYRLLRDASGRLRGDGRFSVSGVEPVTTDISVSAVASARFLDCLATVALVTHRDEPLEIVTDSYPFVEMAIHVDVREMGQGGGIVLLFSESQGEAPAPWRGCIGGEHFVLSGAEIDLALKALDRPLQKSKLRAMM